MEEIFKKINKFGYELEVSNLGTVKLGGKKQSTYKSNTKWSNPYLFLTVNGRQKGQGVHRLMAEAFLPDFDEQKNYSFKDGNRNNLCINNIIELKSTQKNLSKTKRPVLQYTLDDKFIFEWPSVYNVAKVSNWKQPNIQACASGKKKQAYGFKWKFKE